jgi:hypothetical protein
MGKKGERNGVKAPLRITGLYAFRRLWRLQGSGWLGRSAYVLAPTPASTHSLPALEMLRISLSGPPNRRIQPERYAQ